MNYPLGQHQPPPKPTTRDQRPHAIYVEAKPFRTSLDRAREYLEAAGIPFEVGGTGELNFKFRAYSMVITTQHLAIYPKLKQLPFTLPMEQVLRLAVEQAGVVLEAFITHIGFRCYRDGLGRLALHPKRFENGYPGNEMAEKSKEDGQPYVIYAYDKESGKASVWGDQSLKSLAELETNSKRFDVVVKELIQSMDNGEISPYIDEIKTRRHITELYGLVRMLAKGQAEATMFFTSHNSLIQEITKDMKELREERHMQSSLKHHKPNDVADEGQKRLEP